MIDTAPEVDAAFTAMFAAVSGSDRVRMMCEMFDSAKALAAANIRANHPGISMTDLRVKLFERLYSDDLAPEALARFVAALQEE